LGAKYLASMALTGALLVGVILAGLIAGGVVFGFGPLPTLSGTTLSTLEALVRVIGSGVYILVAASGISAVGLFISTLTDSGPGAIVATVIVAIASQVIDQIPNLHVLHPFVPTHGWLGFTGLFRFPVDWSGMRAGLTVSVIYTAVFMAFAAWNFRRRDITS
jgi:ABC-2 type transport system permease protein